MDTEVKKRLKIPRANHCHIAEAVLKKCRACGSRDEKWMRHLSIV